VLSITVECVLPWEGVKSSHGVALFSIQNGEKNYNPSQNAERPAVNWGFLRANQRSVLILILPY